MCKFGLEIIPVSSGTTCPESLAQYDRNIHNDKFWLMINNFKSKLFYRP